MFGTFRLSRNNSKITTTQKPPQLTPTYPYITETNHPSQQIQYANKKHAINIVLNIT